MRKCIIILLAMMLAISAVSAVSFSDDFERTEYYPSITGWLSNYGAYLDGTSLTNSQFHGGGIFKNLSTLGVTQNENWVSTINFYSVNESLNGYGMAYLINTKNATTSYLRFWIDGAINSTHSNMSILCGGLNCSCVNTSVSIPTPKYGFDKTAHINRVGDNMEIIYNGALYSYPFTCDLDGKRLFLIADTSEEHFEDFTFTSPNTAICNPATNCVMYEDFPYNDSIYQHGWQDLTGNDPAGLPNTNQTLGGASLLFDNFDGMFMNNIYIQRYFDYNADDYQSIDFQSLFTFDDYGNFYNTPHNISVILANQQYAAVKFDLVYNDLNDTLDVYYYLSGIPYLIFTKDMSLDPLREYQLNVTLNFNTHIADFQGYNLVFLNNIVPDRMYYTSSEFDSNAAIVYNHFISIEGGLPVNSTQFCFTDDFERTESYPSITGWDANKAESVIDGHSLTAYPAFSHSGAVGTNFSATYGIDFFEPWSIQISGNNSNPYTGQMSIGFGGADWSDTSFAAQAEGYDMWIGCGNDCACDTETITTDVHPQNERVYTLTHTGGGHLIFSMNNWSIETDINWDTDCNFNLYRMKLFSVYADTHINDFSLCVNNVTPPITTECDDGLDNDGDNYTDYPADPACTSLLDDSELPINSPSSTPECNDGIDNDADNLIDYGQDPSCASFIDTTESPTDYYQCNDGIDNDADNLTDYPNDPECTAYSSANESSVINEQPADSCTIEQNCIFKETIPYADSIYLHGWNDLTNNFAPDGYLIQGGNSLLLNSIDNSFLVNFNIYRPFQNTITTQTEFTLKLQMTFQDQQCMMCTGNQSFYYLLPSLSGTAVALLFNVDPRAEKVYIASVNPDGSNTTIATLSPNFNPTFLPDSVIDITFGLDLTTHQLEYEGAFYPFYQNVTPSLVRIASIDYDSTDVKTWFHTMQIDVVSESSVCTSFSPPIYLKENFISGKLSDCGWSVSPSNFVMQGTLDLSNNQPYFQAYKGFYDSSSLNYIRLDNQYSTITFDFQPNSLSTQTNVLSVAIWDKDSSFLNFIFKKNGDMVSAIKTGTLATLDLNQVNYIKIVTNLLADTYDLYVDGVLVQQGITFDYNPDDVTEIGLIYLQSSNSDYVFDNLSVYTSDASGNPLIVFTNTPNTGGNGSYGDGLLTKNAKPCATDADCPTGKCMPYKTCSTFDWTRCDQAGKDRDSWCVVTESTYSLFGYLGQVILDNFLLFIVFLILLMIAVYLSLMMRRKG